MSRAKPLIIDVHGHYTTAPAALGAWRDLQIAALKDPSAKPKASDVQFALGGSYTHQFGGGFLKPSFELTGTALHQAEFADKGLEGLGMKSDAHTQWLWTANPRLTAGVTLQERAASHAEFRLTVGGMFQLEQTMAMPYHPPVKRSVEIAGHKTSISLEPLFWDLLKQAAQDEGLPISALVARIDAERIKAPEPPGLAGAIRLWLVDGLLAQ